MLLPIMSTDAYGVPMTNDPKGFQDIAWGTTLQARPDLEVTHEGPHIREYQFKDVAPVFGGIPVYSLRLSSVGKKFARVTVRYQGEVTHQQIMRYMEERFGPLNSVDLRLAARGLITIEPRAPAQDPGTAGEPAGLPKEAL